MRHARALLEPGQGAATLAKASVFDAFRQRAGLEPQADAAGEFHLRFDRTYQGLPVMGGDIIVHLGRDGQLSRVSTTLDDVLQLPTVVPSIDMVQAKSMAGELFRRVGRQAKTTAELMVVAVPGLVDKPTLAWLVKVRGSRCGQPSWMHYVVDAATGRLHRQYEGQRSFAPIQCADDTATARGNQEGSGIRRKQSARADVGAQAAATGTGNGLYAGTVSIDTDKVSDTEYRMRDTTRGSHFVADFAASHDVPMVDADNTWGTGAMADRATAAVDAAYGQAKTWDYYKNVHGRNGIANNGAGFRSIVHLQEFDPAHGWKDVDNAGWNTDRMSYGNGDVMFKPMVSLDIAGHEMTHGVVENTANLPYVGEQGALDESTADIFGTMVEYYAANAADTPDYLVGEKVIKVAGQTALRYMYKPSLDSGMFTDTSRDCWSTGISSIDVHASSGVGNHFFYLLAEGSKPTGLPPSKVCKHTDNTTANDTIVFAGMGRDDAQKIWYHALTNNFTSTTDYKGARVASLESAKSLFGDDSKQMRQVDYAWLAVNVADVRKVLSYTTNKTWQTAQIVTPAPEVVIMGRRGVAAKSHWYAVYLDAGKSIEANLTAGDGTSNFDLAGYDSTGKKLLVSSKTAGGAKEKITVTNSGTTRKLFYVAVPYIGGNAAYSMRLKLI